MMLPLGLIIGYLIGSISPTRLIGTRLAAGEVAWGDPDDPLITDRNLGYRGVSATAMLERFGPKWGVAAAVLDGLKALIPVLIARHVLDDFELSLAVGVGVVAGHIWPVYHRFHGGRGQACTIGAMVVIDPVGLLVMIIAGIALGLTLFTSVDLARDLYPALALPWFLLSDGPGPTAWFGLGLSLVTALALVPDVRRNNAIRRRTGMSELPWSRRFQKAWRGMFDPDQA